MVVMLLSALSYTLIKNTYMGKIDSKINMNHHKNCVVGLIIF